jgi:hypothetical protein
VERGHPTGRERTGSPTLQTLQDPILLLPWVCFRGGGFPTQVYGLNEEHAQPGTLSGGVPPATKRSLHVLANVVGGKGCSRQAGVATLLPRRVPGGWAHARSRLPRRTAMKKLRIVRLGFGTARQKRVLE